MSFSVRLLPLAKEDLHRIFHFIKERSTSGALHWEQALESGLQRLSEQPLSYGFAPENCHFDFELRQLLFKTRYGNSYRLVYRIDGTEVFVFRICGPGQAPLSPHEVHE